MGEYDNYVKRYDHWSKQKQEKQEQANQATANVTIYCADDGFKIYRGVKDISNPDPRQRKWEFKFVTKVPSLNNARDEIDRLQKANNETRVRWLIFFRDQFGEGHYQRLEPDSWNRGTVALITAYSESFAKRELEKYALRSNYQLTHEYDLLDDNLKNK